MYHERQSLQRCAVHALNNLLQAPIFTASDLDAAADTLSPPSLLGLSPHRKPFTGDYDANVVFATCGSKDLEVMWHDSRDTQLENLGTALTQADAGVENSAIQGHNLVGIILNVPAKPGLLRSLGLGSGRHWIALLPHRHAQGTEEATWYKLDSQQDQPFCLGTFEHMRTHLLSQMQRESIHILIVSRKRTL